MENIELIHKLVLVEGLSQSEVARRLGHTKRSVSKALKDGQPRQYTLTAPRHCLVGEPFIIEANHA